MPAPYLSQENFCVVDSVLVHDSPHLPRRRGENGERACVRERAIEREQSGVRQVGRDTRGPKHTVGSSIFVRGTVAVNFTPPVGLRVRTMSDNAANNQRVKYTPSRPQRAGPPKSPANQPNPTRTRSDLVQPDPHTFQLFREQSPLCLGLLCVQLPGACQYVRHSAASLLRAKRRTRKHTHAHARTHTQNTCARTHDTPTNHH
jgi:hypothetical protein